jgi:hypothetical protein
MVSVEKDRLFLEAGIPELDDYLLSQELYWPLTARGYNLPRLTIGGLLLSLARLEAAGERSIALEARLDGVRSRRRVAWETRAGREVRSRCGLWQTYLADYCHNPEEHADAYPQEVRYRVMLHLLLAELPSQPAEAELISQLDGIVRANLIPGGFVWEGGLQAGFPRETYWYLYGKLKG